MRSRSCCRAAASGASRSAADRPASSTSPTCPGTADIEVGDLLVSSGLGGRFPAGYPAATVVKVETARGKALRRGPSPAARGPEAGRARSSWSSVRPARRRQRCRLMDRPPAVPVGVIVGSFAAAFVLASLPMGGVGGGVAPAVGRPGAALLVLRGARTGSACWWGVGVRARPGRPRRHPSLASTRSPSGRSPGSPGGSTGGTAASPVAAGVERVRGDGGQSARRIVG